MPIYDIRCRACGHVGEVLVISSTSPLACPQCGSTDTAKVMSATSSLTGRGGTDLPGPGDTGCCGSHPGHAGCAGPGSCCGKTSGRTETPTPVDAPQACRNPERIEGDATHPFRC